MTALKISKIEPLLASSPYGDGNNLGQPLGLKTLGFVKVTLDNGTVGFGEAYIAIYTPELFKETVLCIEKYILQANRHFTDPYEIYNSFYIPFASRNGLIQSVYAAVDTALWDAFCKLKEESFSQITKLPITSKPSIYFSGGSAKMSCEELAIEASSINTSVFDGYKIRMGYHSWDIDLNRIKTSIDNNITSHFMLDAIMGTIRPPLSPKDWINKLNDIENLGIYWLEEPLSPDDFVHISELKKLTQKTLAFGEAITGKYELLTYIRSPYFDVLQLDFTHIGGPSFFLDLHTILSESKKRISMHVWGSPLAFNVNTYLGMLLPNCTWTEYPSVALDINKVLCESYYRQELDLTSIQTLIGFSPSTFSTFDFSSFPYVPGTSFVWKPK